MTPSEFKSWFDGFTEAMEKMPTKAQWTRIKERVAEIDGKPVTERVFIDRYWSYPHYHYPYWQHIGGNFCIASQAAQGMTSQFAQAQMNSCSNQGVGYANQGGNLANNQGLNAISEGFNSNSAMLVLGKADYVATN